MQENNHSSVEANDGASVSPPTTSLSIESKKTIESVTPLASSLSDNSSPTSALSSATTTEAFIKNMNPSETTRQLRASSELEGDPEGKSPFWKPRPAPIMGPDGKPLSKNAAKKLLRHQQYLERKPMMKAQEKLKRKIKDQKRREAIEAGTIVPQPKRQRFEQIHSGITVGIDMSFDDRMLEKEIKSMVDQIKRCYSNNRSCHKIVHLALTSFTGTSRTEFQKRANGYELWRNFTIHDKSLEEVWPSEEIPGKIQMDELKKQQIVATQKSEAAKAKAMAAKGSVVTAAEPCAQGSAPSSRAIDPLVMEGSEAPKGDKDNSTGATTEPDRVMSSIPTPTPEEMRALEQMRAAKEEELVTIPAVQKIVYLSADSPNVISTLDPGTCYILGGIVDKNRFPGLCQEKAEKLGLETAQLPISEYIQMSSRRVLTVNQVFEILIQFIDCGDWKEAFLKVIPQRKLEDKPRNRGGKESWRIKQQQQQQQMDGDAGEESHPDRASVASSVASSVTGEHDDGESEEEDEHEHDNADEDAEQ
ncbi:tRNA (guanine(9)-N(1))-methyltransferase [Lunasporangiospora selenospora]|uniref:tRNA (guanine(9)-N1)-methyltransferase n=1 Tax=Lunasporangiospora selenospora TaxID=979761 RepID=A0A9P6FXP2_9FUNG|nr:tRNA (guanine(9)-N(1))-methyltransferase [Lunasporangiospora selenospora]